MEINPDYVLANFNVANLYFMYRRWEEARFYYDKALEFEKNDDKSILNRAITKAMLRDFNGALKDFNFLATIIPDSAQIYFNRAQLYQSMGKKEKIMYIH